jgi:restriction endonuclease
MSSLDVFKLHDRINKSLDYSQRVEFAVRMARTVVHLLGTIEDRETVDAMLRIAEYLYQHRLVSCCADFEVLANKAKELMLTTDVQVLAGKAVALCMSTANYYHAVMEPSECAMPASSAAEVALEAMIMDKGGREHGRATDVNECLSALEHQYQAALSSSYRRPLPIQELLTIRWDRQTPFVVPLVSGASPALLRYLNRQPEAIHSLEPNVFEEVVAALAQLDGYHATLTQRSHDGGIDVRAERGGNELLLFQCKKFRPNRKVAVDAVRALRGVTRTENATKGILVTTSEFTPAAIREIAKSQFCIEGRDFNEIKKWLWRHDRTLWNKRWHEPTIICRD